MANVAASSVADRHAAYGQLSRSTCCAISIDSMHVARAADQRRRDVEAQRQHEHQQHAGGNARHRQRQHDLAEHAPRRRSQTRRRRAAVRGSICRSTLAIGRIMYGSRMWIIAMCTAMDVLSSLQRRIDQARRGQRLVDQSVAAEQHHPGVAAHQHAGPERQQNEDQHQGAGAAAQADEREGHRIAEQQGADGDDEGGAERDPEDLEEDWVVSELAVVVERPVWVESTLRSSMAATGSA